MIAALSFSSCQSVKDVTEQDKDFFENLFNAGKFKQTVNDYRR